MRKSLLHQITEIVAENEIDVVLLAENGETPENTLAALQAGADGQFQIPSSISEDRIQCYCRGADFDLAELNRGFRSSVRILKLGDLGVLLGLVHGVDIRNNDFESRQAAAHRLAEEMDFAKARNGNNRLIVIGDFNMNPYDRPMNLASGFNAMMTRACASRGQRTFQERKYDLYYNPMWNLFGDETEGPSGTFYDTSNQGPYGWSMPDQVIVNYSLIEEFVSVKILTNAGDESLVTSKGRPDSSVGSDHLPLFVQLKTTDK